MATQHQSLIVFQKQCKCKGISSSPTYKIEASESKKGYYRIKLTVSPGPCCDVCGEPWKRKR